METYYSNIQRFFGKLERMLQTIASEKGARLLTTIPER
jgi:hypothetical protein